jgi:hypothetical protein
MASEDNLAEHSAHPAQQTPLNPAIRRPGQSPLEELSEQHEDGRRVSVIPLGDHDAAGSRAPFAHLRNSVSSASESKLIRAPRNPYRKYSLSSYEHPYDIPSPERIHASTTTSANAIRPSALRKSVGFSVPDHAQETSTYGDNNEGDQTQKRQGILANMMHWYSMGNSGTHQIPSQDKPELTRRHPSTFSESDYGYSSAVNGMRRGDSTFSMMSFGTDLIVYDRTIDKMYLMKRPKRQATTTFHKVGFRAAELLVAERAYNNSRKMNKFSLYFKNTSSSH